MKLRAILSSLVITLFATAASAQEWLEFPGKSGPGKGKRVVLISGDEEYRSEESMPMLGKLLSQHHGFDCTVLFAIDPATGVIDPNNQTNIPNTAALDQADLLIIATRFRQLPEAQLKPIADFLNAGKPVIGLRTATHAFTGSAKTGEFKWAEFGLNILGEKWVAHHGKHKVEGARGVIEAANASHPVLNGVKDVFALSDVYTVKNLTDNETVLLRAAVTETLDPESKILTDDPRNNPLQAAAWLKNYTAPNGTTKGKAFCTTMGAANDLLNADLRRLIVNAAYHLTGLTVPALAKVDIVDPYEPTMFNFNRGDYWLKRGLKPADFALGKSAKSGVDTTTPPAPKKDGGKKKADKGKKQAAAPTTSPAAAAPSSLPLQFRQGERVAFVGNSLAERMNLFGHFETFIHTRFPEMQLVVRNFGFPADAVDVQQRSDNYTVIDDPLVVFAPDTFLCFFGFNESFAGAAGVEKFTASYNKFIDAHAAKFAKAGKSPRFVLISPAAFEATGNPLQPKGDAENANLKLYAAAVREVAAARKFAFVELYEPTAKLFAARAGAQFTINGVHLNEDGDREVAKLLDKAMFGGSTTEQPGSSNFERLRAAINDKSWVHAQDYRMLNGWYVYGGRRTFDTETFPLEYKKIRGMAAVRDRHIWDLAAGKPNPTPIDDSVTGELHVPQTGLGRHYPRAEPPEPKYLTPEEDIAAMKVPEGFKVQLFASEKEFPELANPVQLAFDAKGRLWVSCMPTYPQWRPGDPRPSDRILIFEDTNRDGKADKVKVFYDKLVCPTGFEFWNGGVLVVDEPRILFLKDNDGDDKADEVVQMIDGLATDDTHHTMGAWEWSNGGLLHMLEGVSLSTTVETPYGPLRKKGASGCYVFDPLTLKWRHFRTPGYGNPWCGVFDRWGNFIVGDGTNAKQHWGSPLSGADTPQRRTLEPIFDNEGMRPAVGNEFLYSRQFPDDVQGHFIYSCVINMNGMPRFTISDDGAGFTGKRIPDFLASTNKAFRPVDAQLGPDGALWFGDWSALLIGHMQYSQRDPYRDHTHGRIYRMSYTGKPLLDPKETTQAGKSITQLLDQLKAHESRTRYAARRELRAKPAKDVLPAVKTWAGKLDKSAPDYEQLLCEALWVQEGFRAVEPAFLTKLLNAQKFEARAAAVHVLANEWERIPNNLELLKPRLADAHPRVRLEAVRAASFLPGVAGVELALSAVSKTLDPWLDYTIEHALKAQDSAWKPAQGQPGFLASVSPDARAYFDTFVAAQGPGGAAIKVLNQLANADLPHTRKQALVLELSKMKSPNAGSGALVFQRVCSACHQINGQGVNFGPDLSDVGTRLKKDQIIWSILEPNAEISKGYQTVNVTLTDGDAFSGFIEKETATELTLRIAGGITQVIAKNRIVNRDEVKASSMPEGLGFAIAPSEFLDIVDYLAARKAPNAAKKAAAKK